MKAHKPKQIQQASKDPHSHGGRGFGGFIFTGHWVEVVLTLLGLFYVTYRLIRLPLAPDEWGFLYDIHQHSFVDQLTAVNWRADQAVNATLPVLTDHVCFRLFRFNEIQRIRLLSPLFFGVYLVAVWRVKRFFTSPAVGLLAFIALISNAFVLDYFCVARSYHMSVAFSFWSVVALLELEAGGNPGWGIVAPWLAALAVMSNLSLLYFYGAALVAALFLLRRKRFAVLFSAMSSALMLAVYCVPRCLLIMRDRAILNDEGGTAGLVPDTITSLVKCTLYHGGPFGVPTLGIETVLAWAAVALVVASTVLFIRRRHGFGLITSFCLVSVAAMIVAGHWFLGVSYPVERTVSYLIPVFVLQAACLADATRGRLVRGAAAALLLAYSVTAAWGVNLTHECVSTMMADIPALIQDLAAIHQKSSKPVVLCLSDGTKWQVWYYAELAARLPEDERVKDRGCDGWIGWLYFYEMHCGRPTEWGRMSSAVTSHLFLSSDDYPPTWFPHDTVVVREYPVSHWRLYSKTEEANANLEQGVMIYPDFADGHFHLGLALAEAGKTGEAIAQYEQALRIKPDYADAHLNLGVALAQTGKIKEAIAHYEQALRIKPDFAEAHSNLGLALWQTGKRQEAIGHWEQALRLKPDYADAHYNLGQAFLAQTGKIEEAIAHYEQAVRLKPDFVEAHYNLGVALGRTGKAEEAIAHFEQALRIKPDYAEAHYNLGLALAQTGKSKEAIAQYEQAVRLKPDFTQAQNGLARLQAGQ